LVPIDLRFEASPDALPSGVPFIGTSENLLPEFQSWAGSQQAQGAVPPLGSLSTVASHSVIGTGELAPAPETSDPPAAVSQPAPPIPSHDTWLLAEPSSVAPAGGGHAPAGDEAPVPGGDRAAQALVVAGRVAALVTALEQLPRGGATREIAFRRIAHAALVEANDENFSFVFWVMAFVVSLLFALAVGCFWQGGGLACVMRVSGTR
jgi:hypothetical protein